MDEFVKHADGTAYRVLTWDREPHCLTGDLPHAVQEARVLNGWVVDNATFQLIFNGQLGTYTEYGLSLTER